MKTIHVKFDELTPIAFEHHSLEPRTNCFQDNDSLAEDTPILTKEEINNLYGPMFEEYFEKRPSEVSINFAAQSTLNNHDTLSSYSVIVEDKKVSSLKPLEMQVITPVQPSTHVWTKAHLLDQVIGDPSRPVMTRSKSQYRLRNHVYKLKKALYDLKQAPRDMHHGGDILIVQVYVDDIIFGSTNPIFKHICKSYENNFEMSMFGELKFFLGLQVHQSLRGIFISQSEYTIKVLNKHGMDESDSMSTPMATARMDADLQDADHAECHDDCKSTSGGLQFLGKKLVSWSSKNQDCIALSTAKAKYVSLSACSVQVIWMRTQLLDHGYKLNRILMYCDSKSAIAISYNPVQHSRTKNIDIRYHFIKEHVERGTVELYFVRTEYQLADLFTKALLKECFEYIVHRSDMDEYGFGIHHGLVTLTSGSMRTVLQYKYYTCDQIHHACLFSLPECPKADNTNLASHLPQSLFDDGSGRISIVIVNTKEYHSDVLAESQG
ncbi:retrovirus-related pol polyprotein from transposon TNT 1-94 [Tanacetum coccineum]